MNIREWSLVALDNLTSKLKLASDVTSNFINRQSRLDDVCLDYQVPVTLINKVQFNFVVHNAIGNFDATVRYKIQQTMVAFAGNLDYQVIATLANATNIHRLGKFTPYNSQILFRQGIGLLNTNDAPITGRTLVTGVNSTNILLGNNDNWAIFRDSNHNLRSYLGFENQFYSNIGILFHRDAIILAMRPTYLDGRNDASTCIGNSVGFRIIMHTDEDYTTFTFEALIGVAIIDPTKIVLFKG